MSRQGRWEYLKAIYPRYNKRRGWRSSGSSTSSVHGDSVPSEVGAAPAQRARPRTAARGAPAAAADVWRAGDPGAGGDLAGGGLSLVGASPGLLPSGSPGPASASGSRRRSKPSSSA